MGGRLVRQELFHVTKKFQGLLFSVTLFLFGISLGKLTFASEVRLTDKNQLAKLNFEK